MIDDVIQYIIKNNEVPCHTNRFVQSLAFIEHLLKPKMRVLCLGGFLEVATRDVFADVLAKFYECTVHGTESDDLRYPFAQNLFVHYDLILCMELIEHIKDRNPSCMGDLGIFTGSGIRNMLSEARALIADDGHLFLTTPNLCSYEAIYRAVVQRHPFHFEPHVRELAPRDVAHFLTDAGFSIKQVETCDVWGQQVDNLDLLKRVKDFVDSTFPNSQRGQCLLVLAQAGGTDRGTLSA